MRNARFAPACEPMADVLMNYLQQLWRAELLGLASLVAVSLPITVVLVLFFDLGPGLTGWPKFSQVFLISLWTGCMPVVTYGAPIFAIYLSKPTFRLIYLLGFAALPGIVLFLGFGSDLGLGLIPYGLAVALTMCGLARLWPGGLGEKAS